MTTTTPPDPGITHLDARVIRGLGQPGHIVDGLEHALRGGTVRPESAPNRTAHPTPNGEILLMPASDSRYAGVKLLGLAPGNRKQGLPTISGLYVLMDGLSLRPIATMDGAELTALRTAAVSALAVRYLMDGPIRSVVVFGTGPQARVHVDVLSVLLDRPDMLIVGRTTGRSQQLAEGIGRPGVRAGVGTLATIGGADLVLCCTNSTLPLFGAKAVSDGTVIVAVGSHHPDAAELDVGVMARSTVVVESREAAMREAGEVVQAVASGRLRREDLVGLAELVRNEAVVDSAVRVFKSVGMAWEDLVVAGLLYEAYLGSR